MSENREIWFIEGSLAEKLAAPLRENYHLCRLSAKSQSAASSKPDTGCAANYGVVLADMRDGAPMLPAALRVGVGGGLAMAVTAAVGHLVGGLAL